MIGPTIIMFDANLFGFCWTKPVDMSFGSHIR